MFTIVQGLPKLSEEIKEAINQGVYRLLRFDDSRFVLMMGGKIFVLKKSGELDREIKHEEIPESSFRDSLAFKSLQFNFPRHEGLQ
jgi:hypothetical protein